ncbi:OmpA family protein [Hymenobacter sp. M29]|uniref:OmpA family protein n=1 Tax=Hymenobacter mellowenesis TaxID=3063995 RepID=A0ABT9AEE7_9BACT|nr:OmpA family protein [Hymenobacter sp. M29]MDO7848201.1 OmpA family protein [Hymenobacter sp. M29]
MPTAPEAGAAQALPTTVNLVEQTLAVHGRVSHPGDSTRGFPGLDVVFRSLSSDSVLESRKSTTNARGEYNVAVTERPLYQVALMKDGLTIELLEVSLRHNRIDSLGVVQNFYLNYDEVEEEDMPIYQTFFDVNRATLKPEFLPRVDKFIKRFKDADSDSLAIIIEGHAEPGEVPNGHRKTEQYLMGIGWERARATCAYLEKNGVQASKLFVVSYGAQRPAAPNTTAEYRRFNRRVELKFSLLSYISKYRSGGFAPNLFGGRVFPYLQSSSSVNKYSGNKPAPTIRHLKRLPIK